MSNIDETIEQIKALDLTTYPYNKIKELYPYLENLALYK